MKNSKVIMLFFSRKTSKPLKYISFSDNTGEVANELRYLVAFLNIYYP